MSTAAEEDPASGPDTAEVRDSRISWTVLGFIALSLAAHAFAFILFQVVYPQRVTIPPPGRQVALLTPGTPEADALLRWVDAEDPALAASSSVAVPPSLFEVPYRPSFEVSRTAPRLMPDAPPKAEPPPSPITLPLLPLEVQAEIPTPTPAPRVATSASFSSALGQRKFRPAHPIDFHSAAPLEPASFLVAVGASGEIRHVFRQRSSGDPAADAAAAEYLTAGAFASDEKAAPLTWSVAAITWGAEIYEAPAASAKTP
jgi:hypothetical protein